jgi:hypothetical protein
VYRSSASRPKLPCCPARLLTGGAERYVDVVRDYRVHIPWAPAPSFRLSSAMRRTAACSGLRWLAVACGGAGVCMAIPQGQQYKIAILLLPNAAGGPPRPPTARCAPSEEQKPKHFQQFERNRSSHHDARYGASPGLANGMASVLGPMTDDNGKQIFLRWGSRFSSPDTDSQLITREKMPRPVNELDGQRRWHGVCCIS